MNVSVFLNPFVFPSLQIGLQNEEAHIQTAFCMHRLKTMDVKNSSVCAIIEYILGFKLYVICHLN